jgi:glycerol-3-phosphate dehydrogenase (NAD(P)+)
MAMTQSKPAEFGVLGAGAFGTAMAMTLAAAGAAVALWGRDAAQMVRMAGARVNQTHLPGLPFPDGVRPGADLALPLRAPVILLAVPTQGLRGLLTQIAPGLAGGLAGVGGAGSAPVLVLCCKGIEQGTGFLPGQVVGDVLPGARWAVLTGPSFAADLAAGKPTALTLATRDPEGAALQAALSTPGLRLYLSDDPDGAQLGGALKNVVAIAAGIAMGAGLGDSARAALMTRGFAEMVRHAETRGAARDTLFGLSGFGDLVLTCTSVQSRNFRHGQAIGAGQPVDRGVTVEGVTTARALVGSAPGADLPVTRTVAAVLDGQLAVPEAVSMLLARPLRREG